MTNRRLRLGTRASALARWQADWVATQLRARGLDVELIAITTRGDASQRDRIGEVGSSGVFTKEIQRALLDAHIDLAVHSLKDLPTDAVEGLVLSAVPERESAHDVLVSRAGKNLDDLPAGAVIGTGSLRRRAQLLHLRPDLQMRDIRGNVDTRLEKLAAGQFGAVVLAHAGLKRLGLEGQITQILPFEIMLPAVGQGALAIEARRDDSATRAVLDQLDHQPTHQAVLAERTLLATLLGGCLAPVGSLARLQPDRQLRLEAVVLSPDGRVRLAASGIAGTGQALELGADVAGQLIAQGASELIQQSRQAG
ncbi:MAG: hydroxymethylbilane synthase [Planctomycetia bacterium]|nr:hydroxymethylbilane synthase [Planctomycetia bacterium]